MADTSTAGIAAVEDDEFDEDVAVIAENEDGSVTVDFEGEQEAELPDLAFDDDLTPLFDDQTLGRLGSELTALVDQDDQSRDEWKTTYANGLNLLGLKYEERTDPWEGACGAFHPMLLESVIRFNAQAMMDIFPGAGPVKTQIVGKITEQKERQAARVRQDLNYLTTQKIKGYRSETDMMLFNLPMAGTTFRKFGFDKKHRRPWAEYVLPEHVIMPYTASSLESTDRYTVILKKTKNWIEAKIADGFFRDVEIGNGQIATTEIEEEKNKIEGRENTASTDQLHTLQEVHIEYYFEEDSLNDSARPIPYVVTIDKDSTQVLAIRRDWKENDDTMERQVNLVQHKYMPGFGPYGIGLINILGGLTESATSILRQLVDAGTLSNLRSGFKTKNARIKDDSTPLSPGEWRDVDAGMDSLKDTFFPVPYGEPSTVLAALLGQIVDEGRRIGSVADMKVTDMTGQNMPVGTTLAIIERSMKVMSAVQQRLYNSFAVEFKVLAEIVRDFMGEEPYEFELDERDKQATRAQDYDNRVDVIPVADPNATTMAQRIMINQAVIQLYQSMPSAGWDVDNLARDTITVLGSDKADFYLPPKEEVQPADPVTENMRLINMQPVKAGLEQDHEAHIKVHLAAVEDPQIQQLLQNNPAAPAIAAAAASHIQEHMAFQYRFEIENMLGVPLPPPGEPLPEDVEYELSRLAASAADKLLAKHSLEAQREAKIDAMEDPVVQNESRALDIKEGELERKRRADDMKFAEKSFEQRLDAFLEMLRQTSETERTVIQAAISQGTVASNEQIKSAELAAQLGSDQLRELAKLFSKKIDINEARRDEDKP